MIARLHAVRFLVTAVVGVVGGVVCAANTASNWTGAKSDYLNEAENWSAGLPSGAGLVDGFIYSSASGDFTVKVPAGGWTEASYTAFRAKNGTAGKSVLLDSVGTFWLKAKGTYPAAYQAFMFSGDEGTTGHFFTIEGVKNTGTQPVMKFSDGQIRFTAKDVNNTGSTVDVLSGTLNTYDPEGTAVPDTVNVLRLTTARACGNGSRVIFRDGTHLRANNVEVNGGCPDSPVVFEGGTHEIMRTLSLGTGNPSSDTNPTHPVMLVTGGTLDVYGAANVAGRGKAGSTALLQISGGQVNLQGGSPSLNLGAAASATGTVAVTGTGRMDIVNQAKIGSVSGSVGVLELADSAIVSLSSSVESHVGEAGSVGQVDLVGTSQLLANNLLFVGHGAGASARIHIGENATFKSISGFTLGNSGDSEVLVDGNGRLELGGNCWCGRAGGRSTITIRDNGVWALPTGAGFYISGSVSSGSYANVSRGVRISLEGGSIDSTDRPLVVSGTNSVINLAGGTSVFKNISLGASSTPCTDSTNVLTVSGGRHEAREALMIGETGVAARFELLGGTLVTRYVQAKGETAQLIADGGALEVSEGGWTAVSGFASAVLGNDGLTVDIAEGRTSTNDQSYVDAPDATGVFTKTGAGTLAVVQASTHAKTVVSSGVLALASGVTSFGRTLSVAADARVVVDVPAAVGSYTVLSLDEALTPAELYRLAVAKPNADYLYQFAQETTENGMTVTCGVSENDGTGTEVSETTTFKDAVTLKNSLTVTAANVDVTFNGPVNVISSTLVIDVPAGSTVTFNNALFSSGTKVVKKGAGKVIFKAASPEFHGSWESQKGVFELGGDGVLGTALSGLTILSDTLRNAAEMVLEIPNLVTVNAESDQARVVIDAPKDLTLAGGLNSLKGGIVKTGAGVLAIEYGAGTFALGSGDFNTADGNLTSVPADGSSPAPAASGRSAALQILDGGLSVKGLGRDKTTVNQKQVTFLGTGSAQQSVEQVMTLDSVKYMQGGASRPLYIGYNTQLRKPAAPVLNVTNSYLWVNTLTVGSTQDGASYADLYPTLAVTNSEIELQWSLNIGSANDKVHPTVRIGAGSVVRQYRNGGSSEGIEFHRDVDVEIADGGVLATKCVGNTGYKGMLLKSGAWGKVCAKNGGVFSTDVFTCESSSATEAKHLDFVFDGGVLELTKGTVPLEPIALAKPEYQGFVTEGAGMTIRVGEETVHTLATPVRGGGSVTKTGVGTLTLAAIEDNGCVFRQTGATLVSEGVLDLGGTTQTFAALGGAGGTVQNGTVKGALLATVGATVDDVPVIGANVTFSSVRMEVEGDAPAAGMKIPVARITGTAVPAGLSQRSADRQFGVAYTVEDGVLYATLGPKFGLMLIVR